MTKPLFDVFRAAMLECPNGSRKAAQDAFIARVKADQAYFEALAIDYFERMSAVWKVAPAALDSATVVRTEVSADKAQRTSASRAAPPTLTLRQRERYREETVARTEAAVNEMKARLRSALLDLQLPDGKLMREATGAELIRAGGFFTAVGKAIKPTQVVDKHLTEADLKNIHARYYQQNEVA